MGSCQGFSFTHALFNFIVSISIGLALYHGFMGMKRKAGPGAFFAFFGIVAAACAVGIFIKSALECYIYGIAPMAKLPKALLAFGLDTATITLSYPLALIVKSATGRVRRINGSPGSEGSKSLQ